MFSVYPVPGSVGLSKLLEFPLSSLPAVLPIYRWFPDTFDPEPGTETEPADPGEPKPGGTGNIRRRFGLEKDDLAWKRKAWPGEGNYNLKP